VSRYGVVLDIAKTTGKIASASVAVRVPGTSAPIPGTLFASSTGAASLANPFTAAAGSPIEFWLSAAQLVDVQVTPSGQPAQTLPSVPVSQVVPTHSTMTAFNGKVVNWFLS
jgi:hypothetical protein